MARPRSRPPTASRGRRRAGVLAAIAAACLVPAPAKADGDAALVRQLGDVDPAVRREATRRLTERGSAARTALAEAANADAPAIAGPAAALLLRIDSGLGLVPGAARSRPFDDAAIRLATSRRPELADLRDVEILLAQPVAAAPIFAGILRLHADAAPFDNALIDRLRREPIFDTEGRALPPARALARFLLREAEGSAAMVRWLGPGDRDGVEALALAATRPDSAAWRWARGDPEAELPGAVADWPEPRRRSADVARAILFGLKPALPEATPAEALVIALADPAADPDDDLGRLAAAAGPRDEVALAAAGRLDDAIAGNADDPIRSLALLLASGRYEAFAEAELPEDRRLSVLRDGYVRRFLESRHVRRDAARPPDPDGFARAQIEAAFDRVRDDRGPLRAKLERLSRDDPAEAGWLLARAAVDDEATRLRRVGRLMTLDDAAAKLEAAKLRLAFGDEPTEALADVLDAAGWALLSTTRERHLGGVPWLLADAAVVAEEADDHLAALRLRSAALLTLLGEGAARAGQPPAAQTLLTPGYQAVQLTTGIYRSRALLAQGAGDEAGFAREEERLRRLSWPDVGLVIRRVRHLDATGRGEEANRVFASAFADLQAKLTRFPESPMLHNQAAWVASRCRRRADTAVDYASRAVALHRGWSAAYLDTLAEAHHLSGNDDRADSLMRLALQHAGDDFPLFVTRLREIHAERNGRNEIRGRRQ